MIIKGFKQYFTQLKHYFRQWWRGEPHLVVGDPKAPYLRRWWIIPRNPFFNVYLHEFLTPDDPRALHDHPWHSLSILLKGKYIEHVPAHGRAIREARKVEEPVRTIERYYFVGDVVYRKPTFAHRIDLYPDPEGEYGYKKCITLFITGPSVRQWGFLCPEGWVLWTRMPDKSAGGCGEVIREDSSAADTTQSEDSLY